MIGFILASVIFVLGLILLFQRNKRQYWIKQGVPCPQGYPFVGHFFDLIIRKHRWKVTDKYYQQYKSDGLVALNEAGKSNVVLCDLDLIKNVLVKDFDHFMDRRDFKFDDDVLDEMLSIKKGEGWRALRASLTPTFTSGKIKKMFGIISEKAELLVAKVDRLMTEQGFVDAKPITGFYSMDVIATCAFGLNTNYLTNVDGSNSAFLDAANEIISPSKLVAVKFAFMMCFPKMSRSLGLSNSVANSGGTRYMSKLVSDTFEERAKSNINRGDFLDLLVELLNQKDEADKKYEFTKKTLISQSILFFLAGYDTTSNSISMAIFNLAKHRDVQEKLREELHKIIDQDGEFNYQNISESHYLDAVLSESIRIHPPAVAIERACTKDFEVTDTSGRKLSFEKGNLVTILPWSLHYDPQYWENPQEFQPERFMPENKANIVPFTYMPFGIGPRNCIAMRFAQMNVKICLANLFLNFEMTLKPGYEEPKFTNDFQVMKPTPDSVRVEVKRLNLSE